MHNRDQEIMAGGSFVLYCIKILNFSFHLANYICETGPNNKTHSFILSYLLLAF